MNWQRQAYHRYQVGDRVKLHDNPWSGATEGEIIEVQEHSKPKQTIYRVRLDDNTEVNARETHLRPILGSRYLFDVGEPVNTPLGPGKVHDRVVTPLGNTYRVDMDFDGAIRDFLESEIQLLRTPIYASDESTP